MSGIVEQNASEAVPVSTDTTIEELADLAYRSILGRPAEKGIAERWAQRALQEPKERLMANLVNSPEFQRNYLHRLVRKDGMRAVADINNRLSFSILPKPLHQQRLRMIKEHLPVVPKVLDLGGASGDEQGALLSMGYRGAEDITIIDLPPDIRFKAAMEKSTVSEHHGTTVRYAYHSMSDLERYDDESFDFIWSGETIEHIPLEAGDNVFKNVQRILKPGGIFALDTPNRTVTRLGVGDTGFIHAEHAHEYRFEELLERHKDCGLDVIETKGLMDARRSLEVGYLLPDEMAAGTINDTPETSYVFFVKFQKPA